MNLGDPRISDLVYWPGEYFGDGDNSREMTVIEMADVAIARWKERKENPVIELPAVHDPGANKNRVRTNGWSNLQTRKLYENQWHDEPELARKHEKGEQCGGCSFFAEFNEDWGLCCHPKSRHHLETVFEHFTCAVHVNEGWGPHSFTTNAAFHCRCQGEPEG